MDLRSDSHRASPSIRPGAAQSQGVQLMAHDCKDHCAVIEETRLKELW